MERCFLCPRRCGADRDKISGFCGGGNRLKIAKIMVHYGEEPVISGTRGSGAVFFSGCNLRCVYCQNTPISKDGRGKFFTEAEFTDAVLALCDKGVHNIDLITAGHYVSLLAPLLEKLKPRINVPVIYNSSGYEYASALKMLDGLVDVYLPDFKYYDDNLAAKYSAAPDYRETAEKAVEEMLRQCGKPIVENGIIKRGVIIRHLVLPGSRSDSINVIRLIAEKFGDAAVSIMRQYTPVFNRSQFSELNRSITSFEYDSVVKEAVKCGLKGFTQIKGCETKDYTPDFNEIY